MPTRWRRRFCARRNSRPRKVKTQHATASSHDDRFNAILDEYGRLLRNAIARFCPKDLGLQFGDIEQDARIRLWRALQSERDITDLPSYLYRIAATTTIDAVRRVKARREEALQPESAENEDGLGTPIAKPEQSPERIAARREFVRHVDLGLSELSDDRRRAVRLHLQGFTSQETANLLGWSEPRARNLTYRGLRELRMGLRGKGIEYDID